MTSPFACPFSANGSTSTAMPTNRPTGFRRPCRMIADCLIWQPATSATTRSWQHTPQLPVRRRIADQSHRRLARRMLARPRRRVSAAGRSSGIATASPLALATSGRSRRKGTARRWGRPVLQPSIPQFPVPVRWRGEDSHRPDRPGPGCAPGTGLRGGGEPPGFTPRRRLDGLRPIRRDAFVAGHQLRDCSPGGWPGDDHRRGCCPQACCREVAGPTPRRQLSG